MAWTQPEEFLTFGEACRGGEESNWTGQREAITGGGEVACQRGKCPRRVTSPAAYQSEWSV